ncbi:MAG: signal peptidase I [Desulfamplus sp.]|nr:signal peptidase I [Desulfamplus sp.]
MLINKPRKSWVSGILTFLTIGLGHIYSGHAQKGIILFFGQYILSFLCLLTFFFYTNLIVIFGFLAIVIVYFICCLIDAIKLSKANKAAYELKKYNRWYFYLIFWILSAFVIQPVASNAIKKNLIQAYKIPASSLEPTLLIGDHLLAKKNTIIKSEFKKGDIIIFPYPEDPSKDFIKRIVAVGGETIKIVDKKVFVNGTLINEPYVIHKDPTIIPENFSTRDNLPLFKVPNGSLFVMGDNRDNSHDSRFWGVVKNSDVKGKASIIYWSWNKEGYTIRWDRIGTTIN